MKNDRIVLISSTGGHFMQIMNIAKEIENKIPFVLITEKSPLTNGIKFAHRYLIQQQRKGLISYFVILLNYIVSFVYYLIDRPRVVISTGAGCCVAYLLIAKILGSKIIFIESFAKMSSPTKTGKLIYKYADVFYVQWETMLDVYPKARYKGGIYK